MGHLTQPLHLDLSALSERPNMAPLARAAVKLAFVLMTWGETNRMRHQLKSLSDEQLDDIGITREEALSEVRRMLWRF